MNSKSNPKILVAGAGSIGTVAGCLLKIQGLDVVLWRRSGPMGMVSIKVTGVVDETIEIEVLDAKNQSNRYFEIVFLTAQEQHTKELCQNLDKKIEIDDSTILVSLQNGLQPGKIISEYFPANPLILGTVWWSATLYDPRLVLYHRSADTFVGIPPNSPATHNQLDIVSGILSQVFKVHKTDDISSEIRKKFVLNVVSPVLALVKKPYPEGLADSATRKLVHAIFDDAITIARSLEWDITDPRLKAFHNVLSGQARIPDASPGNFVHKVSTQIGLEKYGGKDSNASTLLGFFADHGSKLASKLIKIISTLDKDYEPLEQHKIQALWTNWSGTCSQDQSDKEVAYKGDQ